MFFDIGGWWLTCDHMFRRFGTPFASDWVMKKINGYAYMAAIPAEPGLRAEATEYEARYVPRVPRDPEYPAQIGAYLGFVLPHYALNFLDWWRERLRPEIERNFAYLDEYDMDQASLVELAVLLEDAIDIHDRHWKIHWMLNFAQFSATLALNATIQEVKGEVDPELPGRLQSSIDDRNWDSIEALWRMKEEVKGDAELRAAFQCGRHRRGRHRRARGLRARVGASSPSACAHTSSEFGDKAIWSHEFVYPTWRENPAPIVEAVRGYLETRLRLPGALQAVKDDLEAAIRELMDGVPAGEGRDRLQGALDLSLRMNPLTPDHHFFIDQGTNARVRLVLVAIGRKLVQSRCARRPGGRHLPALQRASRADRVRAGVRRPRDSSPDGATSASGRSRSARRTGSARRRSPSSPSRTARSGASRRSSTASRRSGGTRSTGSRHRRASPKGRRATSPRSRSSTR